MCLYIHTHTLDNTLSTPCVCVCACVVYIFLYTYCILLLVYLSYAHTQRGPAQIYADMTTTTTSTGWPAQAGAITRSSRVVDGVRNCIGPESTAAAGSVWQRGPGETRDNDFST